MQGDTEAQHPCLKCTACAPESLGNQTKVRTSWKHTLVHNLHFSLLLLYLGKPRTHNFLSQMQLLGNLRRLLSLSVMLHFCSQLI